MFESLLTHPHWSPYLVMIGGGNLRIPMIPEAMPGVVKLLAGKVSD